MDVHIVLDPYPKLSLKKKTRVKRKKGKSVPVCHVTSQSDLTKMTLTKLLLNDESKKFLASFLAEEACKYFHTKGKRFLITYDNKTIGNTTPFEMNNHDEADTMIVYHSIHAGSSFEKIIVHCADTDVFVGLVSYSADIESGCFMQAHSDTLYDIKAASARIGTDKSRGIIALHSLTGCDITGKFRGKSKLPWLKGFLEADEETVSYFKNFPSIDNPESNIEVFESFLCSIFCPGSSTTDLASARWMIWTQTKNVDRLPPTKGALKEVVKRGWYASKVLGQSHVLVQDLPDVCESGWTLKDSEYEPITTLDPIAPKSVIELVSCSCKKGCKTSRCSCKGNGLSCTDLCGCFEYCENSDPPMNLVNNDGD